MDVVREVMDAERRIRHLIDPSPLEHSSTLSRLNGGRVFLKLEHLQPTGSFKVRGALNTLLALGPERREQGVVAASSGNHGLAVAYAAKTLGARCVVFVPEGASGAKTDAIVELGAEIRRHGHDVAVTETHARGWATEHGREYVSPYNDPRVIGGQGTIAVELARQLEHVDAIFVAVGGGGLASGVAGYAKTVFDRVQIVGATPTNSAAMAESVAAGRIVDAEQCPTLSDGTAGGIEPGAITFELCRELVDRFVKVSEEEIATAMRLCMESHNMAVEGAAGVAVAAYIRVAEDMRGKDVAIVVCGANIGPETLHSVLRSE
ncbi:MAG: threonine/serine dehydratase [SAR202 cluster bacterium]|jgi:threonine dehydratase|nr:threonine/serine dehydratase [SAR202 cluster bacterium]HAL48838.1 serine/threonine dehydratase [Dehalococcoidia bacterium]MDP6663608.1 threonine/serine dehydratase [SAR202 cluster bacterium]MDP6801264.1 threonine/serine dehydratase [SAR202 cluster bacterium]MQG59300.1 threonine/serine dehydratase [SAR202 cluster bacterium]|tara:strand:- start:1540 stop:2499 length:960 start_codon:yes stop_codon:yes gene_type:complete